MPGDVDYRRELESAQDKLRTHAESTRIAGTGRGMFVVATRGRRSVEIYRGDDEVIVDPGEDETLLGEMAFGGYELALAAAVRWLEGGTLPGK